MNRCLRRRAQGFTLIEVMIVVAIIAILATIALPSYNDYIRRGQIVEAFHALSDFRAKMEQYYQDNRNYGSSSTCAADASANGWNSFAPAGVQHFTFACATNTNTGDTVQQSYMVTATGSGGQAIGHVYTIDQNGRRATTLFKGNAVSVACWLSTGTQC